MPSSDVGAAEHQNESNERGGGAVHEALTGFPLVVTASVRWGEMDAFGHVNNVHFFRYFEIARVAFFDRVGFREGAPVGPILASTSCRFRAPLEYPDSLAIGVRTTDVGRDRFTHEYVLVSERRGVVAAVGEGVVVSYDYERGAKAPLPPRVRARIHELASTAGEAKSAG